MEARFVQIHTLHSYPAALLNRDDSGLAKRMLFGDAVRTRISSQCLKRHWRTSTDKYALSSLAGAEDSIRSRNIIERKVIPALQMAGISDEVIAAVQDAFHEGVYGSGGKDLRSRQVLLLGLPEVEFLQNRAMEICAQCPDDPEAATAMAKLLFSASGKNAEHQNFKAFREQTLMPGGLTAALFGRLITADTGADIEAPIHVAHALTVHEEESEVDYFSAMDDLQSDTERTGSAHIGETELSSGLYYGYVVVDVPGLVSNVTGCRAEEWLAEEDKELAGKIVEHLIHLIAKVSPGAKKGSTAPYSAAEMILIEISDNQPRTLANAFRKPVAPQMDEAMDRLSKYMLRVDKNLVGGESRRMMSIEEYNLPDAQWMDCPSLAAWAGGSIREGRV